MCVYIEFSVFMNFPKSFMIKDGRPELDTPFNVFTGVLELHHSVPNFIITHCIKIIHITNLVIGANCATYHWPYFSVGWWLNNLKLVMSHSKAHQS